MLRLRTSFALAASFILSTAAIACGNGGTGTGGGGGDTTSSTTSTTSGTGGATSTSTGTGGDSSIQCASCLENKCSAELAACDADCMGIQACIDAVCFNLSIQGSPDEGACQVHCQDLHPAGKTAHQKVALCANGGVCTPPCAGAPYDFDQCVDRVNTGTCKTALEACTSNNDCVLYKACASTCTKLTDCLACASTASGMAGEKLFEDYQLCVAQTCIAEQWVPHI
jgi:hypothetical protein